MVFAQAGFEMNIFCCLFKVVACGVFLCLFGCDKTDVVSEYRDIKMDDVSLHGNVVYSRTNDNQSFEFVRVALSSGEVNIVPAPEGADMVTDYRDGRFLINGIDFSKAGGSVTAFMDRTGLHDIETGYDISGTPMLSDDGEWIAFHGRKDMGGKVSAGLININDGRYKELPCPGDNCSNPRWSPGDSWLAYIVDKERVAIYDNKSSKIDRFLSIDAGEYMISDLSFSGDGSHEIVISVLADSMRSGGSVYIYNLLSGERRRLYQSKECSISSIARTGMKNIFLYTKACWNRKSIEVYLYNIDNDQELRISGSGWISLAGNWSK